LSSLIEPLPRSTDATLAPLFDAYQPLPDAFD